MNNGSETKETLNKDKTGLRRELEFTPNVVVEQISERKFRDFDTESLEPITIFEGEQKGLLDEPIPIHDELLAVIGAGKTGDMIAVVKRTLDRHTDAERHGLLFIKYGGMTDFSDTGKIIPVIFDNEAKSPVIGRGSPDILDDEHTSREHMTLVRSSPSAKDGAKFIIRDGYREKPSTNGTFVYYKEKQANEQDDPLKEMQAAVELPLPIAQESAKLTADSPDNPESPQLDKPEAAMTYRKELRDFIENEKIAKNGEKIDGLDDYDYDNLGYMVFPNEIWLDDVIPTLLATAVDFRQGKITKEQAGDAMDKVIFDDNYISILSAGYEDFYTIKHLLLDENTSEEDFNRLLKELEEKIK